MVRTRRDSGCAHRQTQNSELGVRDWEFLSVVQSTADGLREACGALWISIPTQTGFSRYTGMKKDIQRYVTSCNTCQTVKPDRRAKAAPLHPNEIPEGPWQTISMDMMGPLPESKGFDTILVVVDQFTKKSFFLPTNSTVTSKGIATLYRDRVFSEHGLPKKVISDRGPQFVSKFMKELYETMGIKGNPSTAYHPQTDGQTE